MALFLLAGLAIFAEPAFAHGGLANYTVGDTRYRGYDPSTPAEEQLGQPWMVQRPWSTIDPIFSVSSPYLACNNPGTPPPPSYIPIRAGETLTAVYWYWLYAVGPLTVWLARCEADCSEVNVNEVGWFKIWEAGWLEGGMAEGIWYQKAFQKWDGSPALWPFCPECAHLNVTGEGETLPPREFLVRFPGVYKEDDPSIKINIYSEENANRTDYTILGGPIWDKFRLDDT
ncbi:hypothetical protein VTI74DRAFT_2273 [Chaetomium olivicolor]